MVLIIPCVVRLDLPPRQKAALAVVLSLSIFVIAASLVRLQLSLRADYRPASDGLRAANTLAFFVMTVLELDIALICASAPTLRLVLARLWPRLGFGDPANSRSSDDDDDDESVDLTSVVSYHGYPWTQPGTPARGGSRSKNPSSTNLGESSAAATTELIPPVPPPLAAYRTPTTLSLRSLMSTMTPRSRGQTMTQAGKGDDRAGLLFRDEENGGGDTAGWQVDKSRRRSSVGFEGYYEQYLPGYGGSGTEKRRSSKVFDVSRRSSLRYSQRYSGRWADSQESFVLGVNDPNSPTRLSPVPDFGRTGAAEVAAISPSATTKTMTQQRNKSNEDQKSKE